MHDTAKPTTTRQVAELCESEYGFRLVIWNHDGKGPIEDGWPDKIYRAADYRDGDSLGVLTGCDTSNSKFLVDADFDCVETRAFIRRLMPPSDFAFGRTSKPLSHIFYTTSQPLNSQKYTDIDGSTIVELRGTKKDGTVGLQTVLPYTEWVSRDKTTREPRTFIHFGRPGHYEEADHIPTCVCYVAVGVIIARHLGHNGFGHDPRLAFAGLLLRAGVTEDDAIKIGEGISELCNNTEVADVATAVHSTKRKLDSGQECTGGPALAGFMGDDGPAVIKKINEWLGNEDFERNAKGSIIKDSQSNIRRALVRLGASVWFDEFNLRRNVTWSDGAVEVFSDSLLNKIWLRIDETFKFRPDFKFFERVVLTHADAATVHPVRDYLASLKWDGVPRLDSWLVKYGAAKDTPFVRAAGAKTLIAAVHRIQSPPCKHDAMLIMESEEQGVGKSTALKVLAVDPSWFNDDLPLNIGSKEMIERTAGKWIIEASELSKMKHSDVETLKNTIARDTDGPVRLAYERIATTKPRHFIIIGTTNSTEYLVDPTGNRRFWPVRTPRVDVEGLRQVRDQLWAEAAHRVAQGESNQLDSGLWKAAAEEQDERFEVDPWEDDLRAALGAAKQVTSNHLYDLLGIQTERRDQQVRRRVAKIMRHLGWTNKTDYTGRDPVTGKQINVRHWVRGPQQGTLSNLEEDDNREV